MPLTAFDPDTGSIILPDAPVSHPKCRDPNCRADLHIVRGTDQRVQHFRHSTHCTTAPDQTRERESMSHGKGRLKCDAYWTPSTSTDINPAWVACSVWQPAREEQ